MMSDTDLRTFNDNTVEQLQALFNYATIGIVVTDETGAIINFNRCAESQFGYEKGEIVGKRVETLIPDQFHEVHVKQRNHYYQHPEPRSMGAGRDLYGKRKDGWKPRCGSAERMAVWTNTESEFGRVYEAIGKSK